jgi:hypothetical protein
MAEPNDPVAGSTSALILDNINQQGTSEYLRMED